MTGLYIVVVCWVATITFSFIKNVLEKKNLSHNKSRLLYTITFFWAGSIPVAITATFTFVLFLVLYK
ncbi:hypothetical protein ES704_03434 [subsurface metagenome]|jgi:hypothetical protein